jgi:hypothetical protein
LISTYDLTKFGQQHVYCFTLFTLWILLGFTGILQIQKRVKEYLIRSFNYGSKDILNLYAGSACRRWGCLSEEHLDMLSV